MKRYAKIPRSVNAETRTLYIMLCIAHEDARRFDTQRSGDGNMNYLLKKKILITKMVNKNTQCKHVLVKDTEEIKNLLKEGERLKRITAHYQRLKNSVYWQIHKKREEIAKNLPEVQEWMKDADKDSE